MIKELILACYLAIPSGIAGPLLPLTQHQEDEIVCLAKNMYFEARNQSDKGKVAVAMVVLNRVNSNRFPDAVCDVVYQGGERRHKCMFSWYCDGISDKVHDDDTWNFIHELAKNVYINQEYMIDVTNGSLFYHAEYVSPYWSKVYTKEVVIEDHIFYGVN